MRITHIRIRVLRSRETGYGHDACEIEAQLEDGDDPDQVADDLRNQCEARVRQNGEVHHLAETLNDLRSSVVASERDRDEACRRAKALRSGIKSMEGFLEAAIEKGIKVPDEIYDPLPF